VFGGLSDSAKDFCATLNLEDVVLQVFGVETVFNYMRDAFAASSEMQLQSDIASFLDYSGHQR
jgi:ribosomal protein S5